MNQHSRDQRASIQAPEEKMSVVHSPYFPGDAGDIAERSTINLKPFLGNAQSSSGPLGMLDASLFKVGQSTEKPNHAGGFEVDMNLPFPIKLHYILSQPNLHDCITWLPHGRAWKVTNQKVFEAKVIPRFFRSDKMASFMRQVNGWAFNRITEGTDVNAYYHEMFLRGIPNLSFVMKRPPKVKHAAAAARLAAGAGLGAPDFDRINKIAPLPASFCFKPILKDAKGISNHDKYGLELSDADSSYWLSPKKGLSPEEIESKQGQVIEPSDSMEITEICLTKADVHYLKHQNETLYQHGAFRMKRSFNSRQA